MSNIITLDESITVARSLHEVFAYISEFSRIDEWDPGVARGHKLTDGAAGVGSEYRIDMKAGFSLHYTVIEFETDKRMLMDVESPLFTAREEIRFASTRSGTTVRYIAKFTFPRAIAAASRVFPGIMDRVGKSTMEGMKRALEDSFEPPTPSRKLALADNLVLPGIWRFTKLGYRASRKRWKPVSAFLENRHALITGATSGVGLAAAKELAGFGAHVTLVARDRTKANAVCRELRAQTGNPHIRVELADMSTMKDVHALAARLLAAGKPIDMLINNAGALFNPRQQTAEGFEKSFALLLLGPYILTERLRPLLAASQSPRVVNVLSGGMYSQKIKVNDLQSARGTYSGSVAYARAKRGLMILTQEWAQNWSGDGIAVNAMHPGWADTPGVESSLPAFYRVTRPFLRSPQEGADTMVWLAASTEAGKVSGKFWLDREQHPSHIFRFTQETVEERKQLLQTLQELLVSTTPVKAKKRARRKA